MSKKKKKTKEDGLNLPDTMSGAASDNAATEAKGENSLSSSSPPATIDKGTGSGSGPGGAGSSGGGAGGSGGGSSKSGKDPSKNGNKKQGNFVSDFAKFLKEVRTEIKKISWPERGQVFKETWSVVVLVTLITFLVLGYDYVLGHFVFGPIEHWAKIHNG
ncbi:MAG: preprotein translocase subunit SecE [Cyanobacteria bacterium TGS_CYA1]|nr:preprotein translocase subunit SecE [Cyanobacteria bacterium TGS_CYA1]